MAAGDYRAGSAAAGGLFGFIGHALGGLARTVIGSNPLATAVKIGGAILGSPAARTAVGVGARTVGIGTPIWAQQAQNPIGGTNLPAPPRLPGRAVVIPRRGAFEPTEVLTAGHGLPRRRRMNVTNPKALRRAIRRAHGFEKLARKVLGFTTPKKPRGRAYFRARAKR